MIHQVFSDSLQSKHLKPLYTEKFPWDKGGPTAAPSASCSVLTQSYLLPCSQQKKKNQFKFLRKSSYFEEALKANFVKHLWRAFWSYDSPRLSWYNSQFTHNGGDHFIRQNVAVFQELHSLTTFVLFKLHPSLKIPICSPTAELAQQPQLGKYWL